MLCVDGVVIGNTITTILGTDITNDWKEPDHLRNPVLYELKKYIKH